MVEMVSITEEAELTMVEVISTMEADSFQEVAQI